MMNKYGGFSSSHDSVNTRRSVSTPSLPPLVLNYKERHEVTSEMYGSSNQGHRLFLFLLWSSHIKDILKLRKLLIGLGRITVHFEKFRGSTGCLPSS